MKALSWLAAVTVFVVTVAVVGVPVVLIRPFSAQTAADVAWAYELRRLSPLVSVAGAALLLILAVISWRRTRWFGRTAFVMMTMVMLAAAWFARQNHFEWMFRPAPGAHFVSARDAQNQGVKPEELVIAAAIGGDALAFPVRRIGYHHVVNTTAGGEPIVATY
jgi:hypothetical protein